MKIFNFQFLISKITGRDLIPLLIIVLGILILTNPINAFAAKPLEAQIIYQSQSILRLKPGQSFTVSARIKNAGTSAWQNSGTSFIAINTADEKLQKTVKSKFQHKSWKK